VEAGGLRHPLVGRRVPDVDLLAADGPLRVYALLHQARPALIDLGDPAGLDISGWADRVALVRAAYDGAWELPILGAVPPPTAVLVRPDGHVAWVGENSSGAGLEKALARWFGTPSRVAGTAPSAEASGSFLE
jgi:hypothetical protein